MCSTVVRSLGQYWYSLLVLIVYSYSIGETGVLSRIDSQWWKTSPCSPSCVAFFCVRYRRIVYSILLINTTRGRAIMQMGH
jgi:hypothetical protein